MKKNVLLLATIIMCFASCKKENVLPTNSNESTETQLADLIQKGDPSAYDAIYTNNSNQKGPKPTVKFIRGVFVILNGDVDSGTCFPHQCVCFTIITWPAFITGTSPVASEIPLPYSQTFYQAGEAELILNASPSPITVPNLESVYVRNVNGMPKISYSTL